MSAAGTGWLRGAATAVAGAALATVLLRSRLGDSGLDAIARSSGAPAAAMAPFVVGAWLAPAAFGTWLWARPRGRTDTSEPSTVAFAVAAALGVLAPIVLALAGLATGSIGRLLLATVSMELTVAAGVGLGLAAAVRAPGLAPAIVAAFAGLLLTLAARFVLIEFWAPGPLIDPAGQITDDALGALRTQDRWLPVTAGAAAVAASAAGALHAGRSAWLPVAALAPLLLRTAGLGLGLLMAGPDVLSGTPAVEWLYIGCGGALGATFGLAMPDRSVKSPSPYL